MSSVKQSVTWDLATRQLLLPKLGHEPCECEDAIAVDTQNWRFAVADGATEAFDARNWAQRLAQSWVQNQPAATLEEFREWVAAEGRELRDSWDGLSLSWYSEEKARTGSFAALVGVELDLKTDSPSWKAIALGDSCLLHCRQGTLLKSLPLCRSESFCSAPVLVASDSSMHEAAMKSVVIDSGSCESGDVLLLLSDGVASWYLERFEKEEFTPSDFFETKEDDELMRFFDDERLAGRMRNDDVAIVRIEIKRRKN
ncbi:MAG TPA: protein phosphatase 2C domain-containing protein [Pyrinomonadaceae bacterium]|nr:protein phosphatase 2C domain-containing protein [Pyrinomonadaceae bacterium]